MTYMPFSLRIGKQVWQSNALQNPSENSESRLELDKLNPFAGPFLSAIEL